MAFFSVIIPVYNVENYLSKCLDSVTCQTFADIEIICVNDGSTDESLSILEKYAQNDKRIRVINKENHGVSAARNDGISVANGEFIMFLDADDMYLPQTCEYVYEKIKQDNPDIVCFGHSNNVKLVEKLAKRADKAKLGNIIANQVFIWNKAFRKSFLTENSISFPIGVKTAEDIVFCCRCYFCKPKYSYIPKSLYLYTTKRENSATTQNICCIENDMKAYRVIAESDSYKSSDKSVRLLITNHFLSGSVRYWNTLTVEEYREKYLNDIEEFLILVKNQFSFADCFKINRFRKLSLIIYRNKLTQYLNKHKINL